MSLNTLGQTTVYIFTIFQVFMITCTYKTVIFLNLFPIFYLIMTMYFIFMLFSSFEEKDESSQEEEKDESSQEEEKDESSQEEEKDESEKDEDEREKEHNDEKVKKE